MTLPAGTKLGPYEILAPLGAGGMGEVYRARDTRLGREVAIKVLPPALASDPERLKRFEREARSASSLNHPNIVTIYDIGSADSVSYIAMELVNGEPLRAVLAGGAPPVRRLLQIGTQIAEGLAKAHAAGIVHRDLKPENVMVTEDGLVKILDFGLAKLTQPDASGPGATMAPTVSGATEEGIILGTVGYMSPEQAMGGLIDYRSDQFSLGSMLYEMATGRRAFVRGSAPETLTAIIREEPQPIAAIDPGVPIQLRWIVERCLAKVPKSRYASTEDLARDLATLRDRLPEMARSEPSLTAAPARRRVAPWPLAVAAAAVAVAAVLAVARRSTPAAPSFRPLTFRRGAITNARFAPDGQTIAYAALWDGAPVEVFLARLDSMEARAIGVPGSNLLAISRSGTMALTIGTREIAGKLRGTLAEMPLSAGAAPRPIAENVFVADYQPVTQTVMVGRVLALRRVTLEMPPGKTLLSGRGPVELPRFSPDGELLGFALTGLFSSAGTPAVQGRDGKPREVGKPWSLLDGLDWAPAGKELWVSGESSGRPHGIYALPLSGRPRLIWSGPETLRLLEVDRGGRALVTRDEERVQTYAWHAGDAREREVSWLDRSAISAMSRDGASILFTDRSSATEPGFSVYIRKLDGSLPTRLGAGRALDMSADGRLALVQRGTVEKPQLALLPTGVGEERALEVGPLQVVDGKLFSDGKRLLLVGHDASNLQGHFVRELDGGVARGITQGQGAHYRHALSNDGRWTLGLSFGDEKYYLYPTDPGGGPPRPVQGIDNRELPVAFASDDRSVYVAEFWRPPPWKIYRLDLATGKRALWKEITPSDPAGVLRLSGLRIAPDGSAYSYSCLRRLSTLYLAEGLH